MDTYQTDNTVSEYRIEVDVIVTRIYVVNAKSPLEAMAAYRAGNAEVDESRSEMENWEEQEDTARIVQDEYDPDDGPCHGCGIDRPDWRSRTKCDVCGVGLCWNCVAMHQCNWPQAPRRS